MQAAGKKSNSLIHESSPYLLQHAYNPVDWLPFNTEAFDRALRENKPMIISIGYSACHWCHVMEHESFEDAEVAALMNEHFICVKVDREERSDVDNLYMQAVQMMTGHGGWPLNCFVMPDGRPFYGGTYFPKNQWMKVLENLANLWLNEKSKVEQYAGELTKGIVKSESLMTVEKEPQPVDRELLRETVSRWKKRLDNTEGGPNKAPKFPLPSNYQFLLRYSLLEKDTTLQSHVELTLRKMAFGGIYDQLHGGFCRYSTDTLWKVPHFEKMLYDNAQLVSLYAEAFTLTGNPVYREVVNETMAFVTREWFHEDGYFYSAFDADSEGVEGKYYTWTEEELKSLLGERFEVFRNYYHINAKGYWEDGNYILMRNENLAQITGALNMSVTQVEEKIEECRQILRLQAASRVRPGLDDKTITSWNALMCSAAVRAWLATGHEEYRRVAETSANFLWTVMFDGKIMYRTYKNGRVRIEGFLEDYVFTAEALMSCYLLRGDETYLHKAADLTRLALEDFENPASELCYYTRSGPDQLVARTSEIADNVMPSSNSQLALNLFYLGKYLGRQDWIEKSRRMLKLVAPEMQAYGSAYSNWACLALHLEYPFREVVVVGKNVDELFTELRHHGLTNSIFALSSGPSELPLTENRYIADKTLIYVCRDSTCGLPVATVDEALGQIQAD